MVKNLKDPNNMIRQLYLLVHKYKGNFDQVIQNAITEASDPTIYRIRPFDTYMGNIGPPPDVNDERIKMFTIRYYNGEIKGLI